MQAEIGPEDTGKSSGWFSRLVLEHTMILILVLVGIGVVTTIQVFRVSASLTEDSALDHAASYSSVIREFRTLYTSDVVVRTEDSINASHDYLDRPGEIPLPATFSIALGERLAQDESGFEVHLYSEYPFPWREETGGLRDQFRSDAWAALNVDPSQPYYRVEDYRGRPALRYASADIMRTACVDCHNSHPDTPKSDWREGDVRGVLEVVFPMEGAQAQASVELAAAGVLGLVAVLGFGVFFVRLRRESRIVERVNGELHQQKKSVSSLLDNMRQAVFAIDRRHLIVPPVSQHSVEVMAASIEGKAIQEVLYKQLDPTGEALSKVQTVLEVVFGEDELQWELMIDNLPRRVTFRPTADSPQRTLRVSHSPIWDADRRLDKILYVVEDISDVEALEREITIQKQTGARNIELLHELAEANGQLEPFFAEAFDLLTHAEQLGDPPLDDPDLVQEVLRRLRAFKGHASALRLSLIASETHRAEGFVTELGAALDDGDTSEQGPAALAALGKLRQQLADYSRLARRVFHIEDRFHTAWVMELHARTIRLDLELSRFVAERRDGGDAIVHLRRADEVAQRLGAMVGEASDGVLQELLARVSSRIATLVGSIDKTAADDVAGLHDAVDAYINRVAELVGPTPGLRIASTGDAWAPVLKQLGELVVFSQDGARASVFDTAVARLAAHCEAHRLDYPKHLADSIADTLANEGVPGSRRQARVLALTHELLRVSTLFVALQARLSLSAEVRSHDVNQLRARLLDEDETIDGESSLAVACKELDAEGISSARLLKELGAALGLQADDALGLMFGAPTDQFRIVADAMRDIADHHRVLGRLDRVSEEEGDLAGGVALVLRRAAMSTQLQASGYLRWSALRSLFAAFGGRPRAAGTSEGSS